ncbi:MAG: MbcA/ParS/Xre antitoxin family protein [Saprospiraceae bacterium]|nr:MbcA/ParS/Xre antitoxin family protein [Saprospiraceae bacterium]
MKAPVKRRYAKVPARFDSSEVLRLMEKERIDSLYLSLLKGISQFSDETIADMLHVNVKTYRSYRDKNEILRKDIQERTLMLLSLLKHGIMVFGDSETFTQWLESENAMLGNTTPIGYLDTISGIKLIDDRLTGIEYGDHA